MRGTVAKKIRRDVNNNTELKDEVIYYDRPSKFDKSGYPVAFTKVLSPECKKGFYRLVKRFY